MYLFLPALTRILELITCTQTNTSPYVVVSGVELFSDTFTVTVILYLVVPLYHYIICANNETCSSFLHPDANSAANMHHCRVEESYCPLWHRMRRSSRTESNCGKQPCHPMEPNWSEVSPSDDTYQRYQHHHQAPRRNVL